MTEQEPQLPNAHDIIKDLESDLQSNEVALKRSILETAGNLADTVLDNLFKETHIDIENETARVLGQFDSVVIKVVTESTPKIDDPTTPRGTFYDKVREEIDLDLAKRAAIKRRTRAEMDPDLLLRENSFRGRRAHEEFKRTERMVTVLDAAIEAQKNLQISK